MGPGCRTPFSDRTSLAMSRFRVTVCLWHVTRLDGTVQLGGMETKEKSGSSHTHLGEEQSIPF